MIGAVGLSGNLSFIVVAITQVLAVGATTVVSHASGRKDQARANMLFNQSQVLSIVAGLHRKNDCRGRPSPYDSTCRASAARRASHSEPTRSSHAAASSSGAVSSA